MACSMTSFGGLGNDNNAGRADTDIHDSPSDKRSHLFVRCVRVCLTVVMDPLLVSCDCGRQQQEH
jgi:hypothetical protein